MKPRLVPVLALILWLSPGPALWGQTTGSIAGTVSDESGAVLPGVAVTIIQVGTGRTRNLLTDDEGRFSASGLVVGSYEVRAELSGFQTAVRDGITLSLGASVSVNLVLRVGVISEQVIVSGQAALVDTSSAGISSLVEQQQIDDLPLNGRSFGDLVALDSSVTAFRNALSTSSTGTTFGGTGARLVIAGLRPELGNILVDGIDAVDIFGNAPGSAAGVLLGVDTIHEFEVLSSNYSAEFGRSAGGTINTVTRSGTNEFHGTAFEFLRNDNLDARNFFDIDKPEFKRNQFGVTLGGPIVQDRTFFFLSYEGLRDRLGATIRRKTLSDEARDGILPTGAVTISPNTLPFLSPQIFPFANGKVFGDGTAEYIFTDNIPTDENYFVVKIDHQFSNEHSMFVRYSIDDANTIFSPTGLPPERPARDSRQQLATVEYNAVLSDRWLSISRLGYNRSTFVVPGQPNPGILPELTLYEGDNRGVGGIETGVTSRAGGLGGTGYTVPNQYSFNQDFLYSAGDHGVKFGFVFKRFQINDNRLFQHGGTFAFVGLENLLTGRLWTPPAQGIFRGSNPGTDFHTHQRFSVLGGFIQDDWKVTPRFTLNLGVRYEAMTTPFNETGPVLTLDNPLQNANWRADSSLFSDQPIRNPGKKNFAPRIGFAWDPTGDGKTAVRGGFGLFFQQLNEANLNFVFRLSPPQQKTLIIGGPGGNAAFPKVPLALQNSFGALVFPLEYDARMPYTAQWNLSIQRELAPGWLAQAAYLGNRGIHLARPAALNFRKRIICPSSPLLTPGVAGSESGAEIPCPASAAAGAHFFPVTPGPPQRNNPNYLGLNLRDFGGDSYYHGFTTSLRKRFSAGYQFQISYTVSKTVDNTPPILRDFENSPTITFDWFQSHLDRGLSGFDVRQNFVGSFSWELPFPEGNWLLEGWQVNGILTLAEGNPFTVENSFDRTGTAAIGPFRHDRPNLVSGASNSPVVGSPDQWFSPASFELQPVERCGNFNCSTLGNVGRNTVIGPGLANFDFSFFKTSPLGERVDLQFRVELFNLFNRANFSTPERENRLVFIPGGLNGTAGRITTTVTTARQIQFGLKLIW